MVTTASTTVHILLFASYAERLGLERIDAALRPGATVADALAYLRALPGGSELPARPLCARNLAHVRADAPLADGDELAVLPPLAGG
ncbi:MAG TPA: MoaD/ThiS family protein [Gemmatimonadales bacterium]|jgi:molybdopterin converting factor small subunit|nr:MoaD/ThiS family protein [Gemmatimonadales bacterium]